ncbi:MAG: DUF3418 domain-containing protein, partial [Verrucomicrobiaceae bacterium]
ASRHAPVNLSDEHYPAIHRSVLSGLLGQVAQRQERNTYKASGNRLTTIFPGSNLYERREKQKKGPPDRAQQKPGAKKETSRQPEWIMAGEIVETSQLFARSVAKIDPEWIVDLGSHLCKFRYSEPGWSVKAGRVLAWERVLLSGLEVAKRRVDYGRINAPEATEIFIRSALVAGDVHLNHRFFSENRKVREEIEAALTRVRSGRVHDLDEAFYRFYAARIEGVSSVHDLNQLVRSRIGKEPNFLVAMEQDLIGDTGLEYDRQMFPEKVAVANTVLPLMYAYSPGEEQDGVTVRVPIPVAERLSGSELQWMVPGMREELISVLLRALPKSLRRDLMPLEPKVAEIVREFQPTGGEFLVALAEFLTRKYRMQIRAEDWRPDALPMHLRPRVEIVDRNNKMVAAGRDLQSVRSKIEDRDVSGNAWTAAEKKWERRGLKIWNFGDLPETVSVEDVGGVTLLAYPG